jgi:hypothetical protein
MFSDLSLDITRRFSKETRKEMGIYFTPKNLINACIDEAVKALDGGVVTSILEPSCGTCEFITELYPRFHPDTIIGVEKNKDIYSCIVGLQTDTISLYCADFLKWANVSNPDGSLRKYALIIGNPPYFCMKKTEVDKRYHPYFTGRPNIYILFLLRSLELLEVGGVLSFIVPVNFLNCMYYVNTRKYIALNFMIKSIVVCSECTFVDTEQHTIILTIQRPCVYIPDECRESNDAFIIQFQLDNISFNTPERIQELKQLLVGSVSLYSMGISASIGSVVWNQCKSLLTNDSSNTRLIYSSNIKNGGFINQTFKNDEKKQYICKKGITGPMMVLNRGYVLGHILWIIVY